MPDAMPKRYRIETVRGSHICLSVIQVDLMFTPDEARDIADRFKTAADELDPRPAFARDAAMRDDALTGEG